MNYNEFRLNADRVNNVMQMFTLANRHWTNYSVDKLELILRSYCLIDETQYYQKFDSHTEQLVFSNSTKEQIFEAKYNWKDRLSILFTGRSTQIKWK